MCVRLPPKKFTLIDLNMHTLEYLYPLFTCLFTIHELDKKNRNEARTYLNIRKLVGLI